MRYLAGLLLVINAGTFAAELPAQPMKPTSESEKSACVSTEDFINSDCTLTWHGVTFYGAYDIGLGWVSHGLPENGYNYEGESLVNRNGNHSQFLVAPNNLSQTGLGIRAKEQLAPAWFGVFNASTGINPQSGQLANMLATNTINSGLPRSSYSITGDGSRAGQTINDEFFGGVSSEKWGALTFGRHRSLGTDAMLAYDPAGGAYSFSFIGYNGLTAGGGDTEDTRWDNSLKYRATIGKLHFGAMYKFIDGSGGCYSATKNWTAATCTPETAHNSAYGLDIGGIDGNLSVDLIYQHYNQAISVLNPLLGPQSPTQAYQSTSESINTNPISGTNISGMTNTVYGIVTDNSALMLTAKYVLNKYKFFGGYEYIRQTNPANPLGIGASAQGGYILSGVEDDNLDSNKIVQVSWVGGKYDYDDATNLTLSFYHEDQNDFRVPTNCSGSAGLLAACAGALNEVSFYIDHHITKRFDIYAGIAWSEVSGGLSIAIPHRPGVPYYSNSNLAPTIGGRFTF